LGRTADHPVDQPHSSPNATTKLILLNTIQHKFPNPTAKHSQVTIKQHFNRPTIAHFHLHSIQRPSPSFASNSIGKLVQLQLTQFNTYNTHFGTPFNHTITHTHPSHSIDHNIQQKLLTATHHTNITNTSPHRNSNFTNSSNTTKHTVHVLHNSRWQATGQGDVCAHCTAAVITGTVGHT
jgi:hypothetical protein